MRATVNSRAGDPEGVVWRDRLIEAFRWMQLARVLDEKLASLYRGGKVYGGAYLGKGQEALSVALGQALRKGDVFAPLIRDGAGRLAFGETVSEALRTCLGSRLGPMRGRDGNVHRGRPRDGYLPMLSHLGAMIPVVNGMLMARRMKGIEGVVGGTTIGEGGTSTGAFHEALNQAAIERLPLVLVIANNQYAYSTPTSRQFACNSLIERAEGYGVEGHQVDGTDLVSCAQGIEDAVDRARSGKGPQIAVAELLRLSGHGEHDDAHYVDPKLKERPVGRDCLVVAEAHLIQEGWASSEEIEAWRQEAMSQVDEAVATVQREPAPDPYRHEWEALSSSRLCEAYSPFPSGCPA